MHIEMCIWFFYLSFRVYTIQLSWLLCTDVGFNFIQIVFNIYLSADIKGFSVII